MTTPTEPPRQATARDLFFFTHPEHWPTWPFLPVVRRHDDGELECGLLAQSNEKVINERLAPFSVGDDPDLVFERHCHFAFGHVDGVSIRVYRADGTITAAFRELCRLQKRLDDYPVLDEQDYSQRAYEATLTNYRSQLGWLKDELPQGWEGEVFSWFGDHVQDRYTANRDDQGGYAPREAIFAALHELGLLPNVVVKK